MTRDVLLCGQDTANVVYIISGRRKSELEAWLGDVPRLVPLARTGAVAFICCRVGDFPVRDTTRHAQVQQFVVMS